MIVCDICKKEITAKGDYVAASDGRDLHLTCRMKELAKKEDEDTSQ